MPPTATHEDIKAHQEKVEKDKIIPVNLPPCPRCKVESEFFKIHAYRERRFLIIVETLIKAVYCALVRFGCLGCGKTFTHYPEFAIPHKHYTQQSVTGFSARYTDSDDIPKVRDGRRHYARVSTSRCDTFPIDGSSVDHHRRTVAPDLPGGVKPCASGKSGIKHLLGSCPLDRPSTKIQNRTPQKTAYRLPASGGHRIVFSTHI